MTSKRILLVEDELLIARNEKRLLESLGYAVIGIEATGEEAIRIIEEAPPTWCSWISCWGAN
ncbi:MAG: hypothetical protein GY792_02055 [Gammaproteobacteria bacterium]|nr:hypothetical protein [Gammaproteobacteria bacterium]